MSYKRLAASIALVTGMALSGAVMAGTINVLWYTGGVQSFADYDTSVNTLASLAPSSPGGNTWNVTFWNGGAMPSGSFNVLVVASPEGSWASNPDYTGLTTALGTFSFGDRELLTGQDADWHYMNTPGPTPFDGPQGFLLDSINWAGSGTGMGLVALGMTGLGECWDEEPTFGFSGYSGDCTETDNVQIPSSVATFPINTDLTSAGLSNWGESAHVGFYGLDSSLWTGINLNGDDSCSGAPGPCYVTIVSAATGSGGIGTVPEPAELGMFGLGALLLGLFVGLRRRMA